jgi:predicted NUDIX family phosphoesterase
LSLILVIETELFQRTGYFQGYTLEAGKYVDAFFAPGNSKFIDRPAAENDPSYKQLIPYVILKHGTSVFSYVRGKAGSEDRLKALRSIGIGGHIEPVDDGLFVSGADIYKAGADREVDEEVRVECGYRDEIAGLINDDSNEVGKVHLGIVHIRELEKPAVNKREQQITQAGFMEIEELRAHEDELETWSRIALEILEQKS